MAPTSKGSSKKKRSRRKGKEPSSPHPQALSAASVSGALNKAWGRLAPQPAGATQKEERRWLLWGRLFFIFAFVLFAATEESLMKATGRALIYGLSVALATWLGDEVGGRLGLQGRPKLWTSFALVVVTVAAVQAFFGNLSLPSDWRFWKKGEEQAVEQQEEIGRGGISSLSPAEQIEYTGLFLETLDGLSEAERQTLRALQKQDKALLSPDEQEEYRRLWAKGLHHLSEDKQKRLKALSKGPDR